MTLRRFYIINGAIVLAFATEHFVSNVYLGKLLSAWGASENVQLVLSLLTYVIWIIAIIVWWKFIKANHVLVQKNIFPLLMLAVCGALLIAGAIMSTFNLIEPIHVGCFPEIEKMDTLTGNEYTAYSDELTNKYIETGVCDGDLFTIYYSMWMELINCIPLLIIALVSFIRGRKKVVDIKKEHLFQ